MAYSNLGITEATPQDPAQTNIWAATVNTNMTLIDNAVAGELSLSVAGSANVTLTSTAGAANQYRNSYFIFTGILTGNVVVLYPAGVTFKFTVKNSTTGSFTLSMGVTNGSGSAVGKVVILPQGATGTFFSDGTDVVSIGSTFQTRQKFTSGSGATYTTPSGCTRIIVRAAAGGGGGGGVSNSNDAGNGGTGGTTTFNSVNAVGGSGGQAAGQTTASIGGSGGTAGSGTASLRIVGGGGGPGPAVNSLGNRGGTGGSSALGGGACSGGTGTDALANTGGGGSGGPAGATTGAGAGGGGGEYIELIINGPAATYTYTVGAAGAAGTAGSGVVGGAGGSGVVVVDEFY